jgi:hypothetical protein
MFKEVIVYDNSGQERNLTALYREWIPEWDREKVNELVELAKKDYPHIRRLEDAISSYPAKAAVLLPYLVKQLLIRLRMFLLLETKQRFRPRIAQHFVVPELLSYDCALRLKSKQKFQDITSLHRLIVEGSRILAFWEDSINAKLREERYGEKVIDVFLANDPSALADMRRMMLAKNKMLIKKFKEQFEYVHYEDECRHYTEDQAEIGSLASKTITDKVNRIVKKAPELSEFIPNEVDRKKHTAMASVLNEQSVYDASIFSAALAGEFRCLGREFENDIKDAIEKSQASMRERHDKKISITSDEIEEQRIKEEDEGDNKSIRKLNKEDEFKISTGEKCYDEKFEEVVSDSKTFETVVSPLIQKLLEKDIIQELSKPGNENLKLIFEEKMKGKSNAEIARDNNLHRNTVKNRGDKIKNIIRLILE